jgi:UPF0042 nucleotide-binding protein
MIKSLSRLPAHEQQAPDLQRPADTSAANALNVPVKVISFGYGHGEPPAANAVVDVRRLRDPHVSPRMRYLTAEDPEVAAAVMATPGVRGLTGSLIALAHSFRRVPGAQAVIAVGCAGGRHRAPAIAAEVARRLECQGVPVVLVHRDIGAPVIERSGLDMAPGGAS